MTAQDALAAALLRREGALEGVTPPRLGMRGSTGAAGSTGPTGASGLTAYEVVSNATTRRAAALAGPVIWATALDTSFDMGVHAGGSGVITAAVAPVGGLGPGGVLSAPADGAVLEFVGWLYATNFAVIDAGGMAVFGVIEGTSGGTTVSAATPRRIIVGVDSAGNIRLVTANAAAATDTDSGVDATENTFVKVRVVWTVGTNVLLYVNDVLRATVTTTLPSSVTGFILNVGADAGAAQRDIRVYGASFRYTP